MTVEACTLMQYLSRVAKSREIIVDAEGAILGRLASYVAKLALMGFRVHVVNVEKAVVTGDRHMVIESYKLWLEVKTHKNPYRHAPHRPRNPINIFKKAVWGMLPKDWRGRKALKRVRAYIGIPEEFSKRERVVFPDVLADQLKRREYVLLVDIAKAMGWKGIGL